jgi:hypothetical protein
VSLPRYPSFIFSGWAISERGVPLAWLFELAGGAITDYEETCIPKAQREAKFTIAALHQWEMGVDDPRCVSSAEEVRVLAFVSCSPC